MLEKIKNTGWLQPIWWLAVLYVWFGTLYPFLFGSHDLGENVKVTPWLSVIYAVLLIAGILLFREKPLFKGIFVACRILQTIALLSLLLITDINWITLISVLPTIPYVGLLHYNHVWLYIVLILFSLVLTILSAAKRKIKNKK